MDRENEGDLIIAAEDVSTEKMAFMVRHTRFAPPDYPSPPQRARTKADPRSGVICTPSTASHLDALALPQMVQHNEESHSTAFTVSVDYVDSTTSTGISAYDRALTARKLADPSTTAKDLRRPGHMFPLRAVEGGVLERTGHTEAAVDFCRLAGKREVGVICELVREEDGLMMRRDDCLKFGRRFGLRVATIEDLIEYIKKENAKKAGEKSEESE